MSPAPQERHLRVKQLLLAAVELPRQERGAFLARACGPDAGLREEVEGLLALDAVTGDDLIRAPLPPGTDEPRIGDRLEGERSYRLLELLGEGGMGRVYLAERADGEYRQRVAIKKLAWFLDRDADAAKRFRSERQILARLTHPNIARLLDGGTTAEGQPYLVMEHVDGVPIHHFAEEQALTTDGRLRLFLKVCDAVRFAHQNLVVHRDLKPGNILVTAEGEPKLLDFGIAKLLDPDLALEAAVTRRGDLLLTPRYASPEQVRGEPVSTTSDVYSLGVILYELLAGTTPYKSSMVAPQEILRAICEELPTPPSAAIARRRPTAARRPSSSSETDSTAEMPGSAAMAEGPAPPQADPAGRRPVASPRLSKDLDAIVLKALRKRAADRFGSVEELADDIRRYLQGLAVAARQGGTLYRFSRFARRHAVALGVAAVFTLTVVAFVFSLASQLTETELQRDLAKRERDKAQASSSFLLELFSAADPNEARGKEVLAKDLVDRGAARIEAELTTEPDLQAALLDGLGRVYRHLGEPQKGVPLLEQALAIRRRLDARPTEALYFALHHLGLARLEASRLDEARALLEEALSLRGQFEASDAVDWSSALNDLAMVHSQRGEFEEAARLMTEVVAENRRRFGDEHPEVAIADLNLASMYFRQGDMQRAEALSKVAVGILRAAHDGDHPDLAFALSNLAAATDDNLRALPILEEALAMRRRLLGDRHPDVGVGINNLAVTLYWMGDYARAEPLLREALSIWLEKYGEEAAVTASVRHNIGQVLLDRGDPAAARPVLEQALAVREKRNRADDPDLALNRTTLGEALCDLGESKRGEALLRQGIAVQETVLAADSAWRVQFSRLRLARCLTYTVRRAEAAALIAQNLPPIRDRLGATHPFVASFDEPPAH